MILDKNLMFIGSSSDSYSEVDLKKEGHLDKEYWLVVKAAKAVAAANAGTWALSTSNDNFTTSVTLATGAIGDGTNELAKDSFVARMKLPFKPLAKLRLSVAATGVGGSLKMDSVEGYLVNGINLASEMKEAKAA